MKKSDILRRFSEQLKAGQRLIGAGAGTGLSGKAALAGGADFLVVYNSGRYRMAGRGSLAGLLAYGDANAIVLEMAREIIPVTKGAPVFAGVNGTDPFRLMPQFLAELKAAGYCGVQNFPTVGVFDGDFRANLETTGASYGLEVDMIREAVGLDMVAAPYVFNEDEAVAMTNEGQADILVAHLGLTTSGSIGATEAFALDEALVKIQSIVDIVRKSRKEALILAHGGPIATSEDWQYILTRTEGLDGFLGASSMERLPVEEAIKTTLSKFKAVSKS
ncbi:MAG: phosphoenolpyruvate hydrolase family protein [Thiobacillus sp.]|nr:phosphoenolpyruvate hydrolase family protein [Thiobacillus sp.]